MSHRILLFTALGLLASCDYLESYVSNEENVLQEDAALPYNDYQQVAVEPRNIRVAVEAAGEVEPVTTVEVKSKASGEILELAVDTGDVVESGTLLAQIDQRVLKNTLKQAEASLVVAEAKLANSNSQLERINSLYANKSVSKADWEKSTLDFATAKSEVVQREIAVENAVIQLGDCDVNAPITGTIIERAVEQGTVISSPMGNSSGGTLLLKMADLSRVQVRMLVNEIDIGKMKPGVSATVNVAAYANRPFQGEVIKVEPQATTVQNVTMFPVLIDLQNREGLLRPGMNADVEVMVADRNQVLAIPNAALRTQGDVYSGASVLGYTIEDVDKMLAASPKPGKRDVVGDGGSTALAGKNDTDTGASDLSDEERLKAIMAKMRGGKRPSEEDIAFMRKNRELMQKVAGSSAGMGRPGGGPSASGGRPSNVGRESGGQQRPKRATSSVDQQFGGDYIVFVIRKGEAVPVHVRTGITDMDYSEVVAGLNQGEKVLILPSQSLVQSNETWQNRASRMSPIPGLGRGRRS
ncbi:efflux RND transporter periplasmic adaptor subunit [Gammaproteobacteria bacterium]|nr:efflux RND transporter periplasmic adaptor subunit [Gammaproteobacteria bacterium]